MNLRPLITLLCLAPALCLAASSDDAQQRLRSGINEVVSIAAKASSNAALVQGVTPVLQRHVGFAAMTRRAVGPGWRTFTPDQQQKATALFTKLVIRTYCNKFTIGEKPQVEYKAATSPAAGRVDVSTITVYQGGRYSVIYRMEQEDGWRATDVVIEGVSMVANYRSQLDPVFKKGGAAAVISSLEQSVNRQK